MPKAGQELPSCRAPKLHIASLVVADLANTWWVWPWGHFVPKLTGGRAKAQRKRGPLCEAIDFRIFRPCNVMQCLPAICQEVRNSILDLVAKHQANSRTNMGRIAAMLSPSRLQCHFPRIRDRMPTLLEELHILQMGFWRWNGITHRPTCPKCPRLSTWQITWAQRLGSTGHLITHKIALRTRLRVSEDKIRMTRCHRMCTVHYGDDWQVCMNNESLLPIGPIKIWFKPPPSLPSF